MLSLKHSSCFSVGSPPPLYTHLPGCEWFCLLILDNCLWSQLSLCVFLGMEFLRLHHSSLFDTCLCVSKFKNRFCNPSITNSSDQSLIGLSGCSTFLVNHSLALPLSYVPKNCTWVSVYLTSSRPCSLSHCSIPATNVSYTSRSELPEYSSGGLFKSFLLGSQDLKVNLCGLQQDIHSDSVK